MVQIPIDGTIRGATVPREQFILKSIDLKSEDPVTQKRIDNLLAWRRVRAKQDGTAAYRILTNRCLFSVAVENPETLKELGSIYGIGPNKLKVLGEEILAQIRQL